MEENPEEKQVWNYMARRQSQVRRNLPKLYRDFERGPRADDRKSLKIPSRVSRIGQFYLSKLIRRPPRIVPILALTVVVLFLLPLRSASAAPILTENFDNNQFDSSVWQTAQIGFGPSSAIANQRLEVTIPSDSSNDQSFAVFGAGLTSICPLRGDYDVQVGFQLLTWPPGSGVRVGLGSSFLLGGVSNNYSPSPFAVERDGLGPGDNPGNVEVYLTNFQDGVRGITTTNATTGMLRLTRTGGLGTGYYFDSGNWLQIHSGPVSTADVGIGFAAWSHDQLFAHQTVMLGFDNFTLSSGQLACPKLTIAPSSGVIGTKITAQGSGFPIPYPGVVLGPTVEVTFDDMFMGTASLDSQGSFTFVFNVPQAQAGPHLVKAIDLLSSKTAIAAFQVQAVSVQSSLSVILGVGAIYFPGDTAVGSILVTSAGTPVGPVGVTIQARLTRPDNSLVKLNATSLAPGEFRVSYSVPTTASIGTYTIVVIAHMQGAADGTALVVFEVKQSWLAAHGPSIAIGAISTASVLGAAVVAWKKGYLKISSSLS